MADSPLLRLISFGATDFGQAKGTLFLSVLVLSSQSQNGHKRTEPLATTRCQFLGISLQLHCWPTSLSIELVPHLPMIMTLSKCI